MVADIRPIRPAIHSDSQARHDEITFLRGEIADAQAKVVELAKRVIDAEASEEHYRGLYRMMLHQYGVMAEQRDKARDTAANIAEQQPRWEDGP